MNKENGLHAFVRKIKRDKAFRLRLGLFGTLFVNAAYSALQLGMGIVHSSFWFYSMAAYYLSLAAMRFFLLRHTLKYKSKPNLRLEYKKHRACGIILLIMNLAVALMTFFMVYWGRTFRHHEITVIALAAYTFVSFTVAVINAVKSKRTQSPIVSAVRVINLVAATVSMLTLETTMLTAFDNGTMTLAAKRVLLAATGSAVSAFIVAAAIYMIVCPKKNLNKQRTAKENK